MNDARTPLVDGPVRVDLLEASRFRLDGGAMFGVVPRARWERDWPPDAQHRIALVARVVLVRAASSGRRVLIDVGLGDRWSTRDRERYAIASAPTLETELRALGLAFEDITDVVLTHLHWDHAGALFREVGGTTVPTFPNAALHVAGAHLRDLESVSPKDAGSFFADDLERLSSSHALVVHSEFGEWLPSIRTRVSDGHTGGLAIVEVTSTPEVVYTADLVPTIAHLRLAWGMAYDNEPRRLAAEKRDVLERIARTGAWLAFAHDPSVAAARIAVSDGEFVAIDQRG